MCTASTSLRGFNPLPTTCALPVARLTEASATPVTPDRASSIVATHEALPDKDREVATQEAMREIALAVGGTYNGYAVRAK